MDILIILWVLSKCSQSLGKNTNLLHLWLSLITFMVVQLITFMGKFYIYIFNLWFLLHLWVIHVHVSMVEFLSIPLINARSALDGHLDQYLNLYSVDTRLTVSLDIWIDTFKTLEGLLVDSWESVLTDSCINGH